MPTIDVVVIGAGAAGLLAAHDLAAAGRTVVVLEARNRIGGRVHTFTPAGFSTTIEAGAEFMHGPVPLTRSLLSQAGMGWQDTAGRTYAIRNGHIQADASFFEQLPLLLDRLHQLAQDMPLAQFLEQEFPGTHYHELRAAATQFAEGYDAADPRRASAWALRDEWMDGGADDSPRPVGGYGSLLTWLVQQAKNAGASVHLNATVRAIHWQSGRATVHTAAGPAYQAQQVVCTVPLGIWQLPAGQPDHVHFSPDLPAHRAAAAQLGFGSVIKILLEFREAFWHDRLPELEFLFSDALVPTWWSQLPGTQYQLTGWLAGPAAEQLRSASTETILQHALDSLGYLLATEPATIRESLRGSYVANWGADAHAHGAYSYATVGAGLARATLAAPVDNTLFFAGEALYDGPASGTVEAALVSGQAAARAILALPAVAAS